MNSVFKLTAMASVAVLAGAVSASAALIDFTDNATGLAGTAGGGWVATAWSNGVIVPNTNEAGHLGCPVASSFVLACQNDGLGVKNDEISSGPKGVQYVTITFVNKVTLAAAHFLDLYIDPKNAGHYETANVTIGATAPGAVDASKAALQPLHAFPGYAMLAPISLKGTQFTFWTYPENADGTGNDGAGQADFALAALEISAVPLPAGLVLMGTALGGLGLARRKRKA